MDLYCNHPGGVTLPPVVDDEGTFVWPRLVLKAGLNEVDPGHWDAVEAKLDPDWMLAVGLDDEPPAEAEPTPAPAAPHLNAKDKAAVVMAAESLDELDELAEGEERKTVLDALEKRAEQLAASDSDSE